MFNRVHLTVNQLIASDLFLGYHIANWNPRTNFFLIGKYKNTNIFNISYTSFLSKRFIGFLSELFVNKGHLWMVNENFSLFNRSVELCQLYNLFPEISFLNSLVISFITIINGLFFFNPNLLFKLIYNFSFYFYI